VRESSCSARRGVTKRIPSALRAIIPKARKAMEMIVGYGDILCN
jgi:hypothetical protein